MDVWQCALEDVGPAGVAKAVAYGKRIKLCSHAATEANRDLSTSLAFD